MDQFLCHALNIYMLWLRIQFASKIYSPNSHTLDKSTVGLFMTLFLATTTTRAWLS